MITLGAVFGGPGGRHSNVEQAITRISRRAEQSPVIGSGSLNIVFHVPGSITAPDYQGVRTGTFSKKLQELQVQISVPPELEHAEPTDVERALIRLMREAVRAAEPVFARARIPYALAQYEELVERLERAVSPH